VMDGKMEIPQKIAPDSKFSFVVSDKYSDGIRIDAFLSIQFPYHSRKFFQQLIEEGLVEVNGKKAKKKSFILKVGDSLEVIFPPERKVEVTDISDLFKEKGIEVKTVSENEDFLIISKPAGFLVHPTSERSKEITLVDWLLSNYPELASVGVSDRPAIIHRLDRDTSGLMIIPRTQYAYSLFGDMFRNRNLSKTYKLLVHGQPPKKGSIDFGIGRDPKNKKKMAAFITDDTKISVDFPLKDGLVYKQSLFLRGDDKKVRSALTHYRVLEYFDDYALVEAQIVTGRMHQIRVHFAAIGHPVVGDTRYGRKSKDIGRQALHAYNLKFPFKEKEYDFVDEPPQDFLTVLKKLRAKK